MWRDISLWFWLTTLWWLAMMSIFSCTCWLSIYLLWKKVYYGTPLQYSCLENLMDGGAWWAAVHGVAKSWTCLSNFTFTFHFDALEKEVAAHSSGLEWIAISFSNAWKWKVKGKSLIRVRLLATPWTAAHQAPPSMGFPSKSTGVGCHHLLRFSVREVF